MRGSRLWQWCRRFSLREQSPWGPCLSHRGPLFRKAGCGQVLSRALCTGTKSLPYTNCQFLLSPGSCLIEIDPVLAADCGERNAYPGGARFLQLRDTGREDILETRGFHDHPTLAGRPGFRKACTLPDSVLIGDNGGCTTPYDKHASQKHVSASCRPESESYATH